MDDEKFFWVEKAEQKEERDVTAGKVELIYVISETEKGEKDRVCRS